MQTDTRIPVVLAGIPTGQYANVINKVLVAAGELDLAANLSAARNPEEALRAVSEKVRFIWTKEEEKEKVT